MLGRARALRAPPAAAGPAIEEALRAEQAGLLGASAGSEAAVPARPNRRCLQLLTRRGTMAGMRTGCGRRLRCLAAALGVLCALAVAQKLRGRAAGRVASALLSEARQLWPDFGFQPVSTTTPEMPRRVPPRLWPAVCNVSMAPPEPRPPRDWGLSPGWLRVCEMKNNRLNRSLGRNWCWVGMKKECHDHLKAHLSWGKLQSMAAELGSTPPRTVEAFDPLEVPEVCDRPTFGRERQWTAEESKMAREWFRNHVGVYVLGLFSDRERWNMISRRLQQLRLWATHVPGVDMRAPGALESAKAAGWVPMDYNFSRAQELAYLPEHDMGSILGTLGCASAHFKVQSKVLADGVPLALVFEDDSWPAEDFVERLWSLVREELPCDWEVTALYSRCPYGRCISQHLARVQPDGNEPAWRCRQGVNWGMQATLYRTASLASVQRKWKHAVFDESRPHCMDVDVALASISDEVAFYAVPAVQDPGFLRETNHPSLRWGINMEAMTSTSRPPPRRSRPAGASDF